MSTTSAVPQGPAPVHFGRRSTRGLLLGLSTARCLSTGAAISVVVLGLLRVVGSASSPAVCSGCRCSEPPLSPGKALRSAIGSLSWGIGSAPEARSTM